MFFLCFGFVAVVLDKPGDSDRFPFLPESFRRVAKKVTEVKTFCVSHPMYQPNERSGAGFVDDFGTSEATILDTNLKLAPFPARSPLPIAASPSMSLIPSAPFTNPHELKQNSGD
jgi:hypothetical protein